MVNHFPFLLESKEGIFFIDNCAFCLNYQEPIARSAASVHRKKFYSIDYLKEESSRLRLLTNKLSNMDNWLTIEEVIREYKEGTNKFIRLKKEIFYNNYNQLAVAFGELIDQRDKTQKLLEQEHVNATNNLTSELIKKTEQLLPQVENIFKVFGGKINNKNTDCKLITTALIYAEGSPTGIFSQDLSLLKTFSYCATKIKPPAKETYILEEKIKRKMSTEEYFKYAEKYP